MVSLTLRGRSLRLAVTLSCASGYLLFGYDQGVLGGLVNQPTFLDRLGNPSSGLIGSTMAIFYPACVVGSIISGLVGQKLGRRKMIFLGTIVMTIGIILQTVMQTFVQFIVGRIITGIGNGLITATIPIYVAEVATDSARGRVVCIQMSIVIFGLFTAYWIDYGTIRHLSGDAVWRLPIALQLVFSVACCSTIMLLPESPRWLFSRGRKNESATVLAQLFDCDADDNQVLYKIQELEQTMRLEQEKLSLHELFHSKSELKLFRRIAIVFIIPMLGQFTGVNVLTFYLPVVLEDILGFSSNLSSLTSGFIQLAYWVGTLPPIWTVERFGRRATLLLGSAVLAFSMILFTISLNINTPGGNNLSLAMLVLFQFGMGMSWSCIPWIIAPEITPLNLRHIGGALGPGSQWLWTTVIVFMAPPAIENTGWKIYILFDIGIVAGLVFVYFFLPETKDKTLEEIDYVFASNATQSALAARAPQEAIMINTLHGKSDVELQQVERV
ncbi:general substrate transporter [Aspergillus pseudoustus]|uniref:General substrate transporter n=1 Tax=Aspergillus pseudoustus TaxID=1810923 RepID=A0ABR4KMF4_9EURO